MSTRDSFFGVADTIIIRCTIKTVRQRPIYFSARKVPWRENHERMGCFIATSTCTVSHGIYYYMENHDIRSIPLHSIWMVILYSTLGISGSSKHGWGAPVLYLSHNLDGSSGKVRFPPHLHHTYSLVLLYFILAIFSTHKRTHLSQEQECLAWNTRWL